MIEGQGETDGGPPPVDITTVWPIGIEFKSLVGPGPLDEEADFYLEHFEKWAEHVGWYVLIRGSELFGFYATRDEALREGLRRFGRVAFLVKQVVKEVRPRPMGVVIF